jgi:hypothetical protein
MRRAILFAMTAATALALSAGTFIGLSSAAEAAKPQLVVNQPTLVDNGDCIATVTWSGVKGGKALDIETRLLDHEGQPVVGETQTYTVRQGDGQLQIDYGPAPRWATDSSLIFEATFVSRDGDVFVSAAGTCVP